MTNPRHLKIRSRAPLPAWTILIGDREVGDIHRMATGPKDKPYSLRFDLPKLDQHSHRFRTMKECREAVNEMIPKEIYLEILDQAYKGGYKG